MKKEVIVAMLLLTSTVCFSRDQIHSAEQLIKDRVKIAEMTARDQAIRYELIDHAKKKNCLSEDLMHFWLDLDKKNTNDLKIILNRWGWPTRNHFSENQINNIFLLIQHADQDPKFQEKILNMMSQKMGNESLERSRFAYLWDRVMMHKHVPQRFGTQGTCFKPHVWKPYPIEDSVHLDERRYQYGLQPFSLYSDYMQTVCP